jgi:hypothetical protein
VRETYYSTALSGSDPNYLRKASKEGDAVIRFGFFACGRRTAGGLKYQVSWCI